MRNKEVIKNVPSSDKVLEWDAKETTEGAQAKANFALQEAKKYADEHKVEKVENKQLSTEDFTTEEKTKLSLLKNYTHPLKHSTNEIATNEFAKFVTDAQISEWTAKESVDGATSKVQAALQEAKEYSDSLTTPLTQNKLDFAEINPQNQLILKANGVTKHTIQLPSGGGGSSSGNYILPAATKTMLGGVIIGDGITLSDGGKISVSLDWNNLSNKPEQFSPESHQHKTMDITDMFTVVDSLTSDSITDALSAKQGKELKKILDKNTHGHTNLTALNLITDSKISEWDKKESTTASQQKASKALSDAKDYVDKKIALIPTMLYYKTDINAWAFDDTVNLYKATMVHNLNCEELMLEAFNKDTDLSEFVSFRIINPNSIELFSENNNSMKISILGLVQNQ